MRVPRAGLVLTLSLAFALPVQGQPPSRVSRPGEYRGYSEATYDGWQRSSFYLTMRDGTRLAMDLFRPTRHGVLHQERLPVVWTHHRYLRAFYAKGQLVDYPSGFGRGIDQLIKHGYVIAVVDTRGGGASFGTQPGFFSRAEAKDAYEITEWLAAQPWSTGKIGMSGRSYLGITQLFAAAERPPHLKAIFPEMVVFEWYPFIYPGGVFRDDFFDHWNRLTQQLDRSDHFTWGPLTFEGVAPVDGPDGPALRDSAIAGHRANRDMLEMWSGVPFRNSIDPLTGRMIHRERSPAAYVEGINQSGVAVYSMAGWMDAFPRDQLLWFANLTVPQKLIIGPWFHGQSQGFDLGVERVRWFDYWLKGIDNGIMREPPIRYFVLDAPESQAWRTATSWPIPTAVATSWYLGPGPSGSASSANDGRLTRAAPTVAAPADSQRVDTTATLGPGTRWADTYGGPPGYPDLQANDAKGWTWTSDPAARDIEVIGSPIMHVWIRSSMSDADVFAYLEDVGPDGSSHYVTEGVLRASERKLGSAPYRNFGLPWHSGRIEDVALLPNRPTELVFDLLPTAKRFQAGHRIRITITGADRDTHHRVYPVPPPMVWIYHDAAHPSRIVLPMAAVR